MLLVADLKLQVADLIHEVAGLRMEVPELRPGEIRLNLTTELLHSDLFDSTPESTLNCSTEVTIIC